MLYPRALHRSDHKPQHSRRIASATDFTSLLSTDSSRTCVHRARYVMLTHTCQLTPAPRLTQINLYAPCHNNTTGTAVKFVRLSLVNAHPPPHRVVKSGNVAPKYILTFMSLILQNATPSDI